MKIALVQTNPIIGDFDYNCDQIVEGAQQARRAGCRLVIFPEMAVSGYPPQGLLERLTFIKKQGEAVTALLARLPDTINVLFGCFEEHQRKEGRGLYNTAVCVKNGAVVFRTRKQLLSSSDGFDEKRYFQPGEMPELLRIEDKVFAVTIGDDIWDYREVEGVPIHGIINISASFFQRGKEKRMYTMFQNICAHHRTALYHVNQVGGQDSLLFAGRSLAINARGCVVAKGAGFARDLVVVESDSKDNAIIAEPCDDEVAAIYNALVMGVKDYMGKSGFTRAVLGLSGGIDSALTATIAVDALGCDNVLGVALPSPYSSEESEEDARTLAAALGCSYEVIPIGGLFAEFKNVLSPLFAGRAEDLTEQNLQARIRGNLLMALSNKFGSLLLSTGNKSEMAVGYCTLYGDMNGGLAVLADVPKMLVYELARYVNRHGIRIPERTITKPPSAELKPGQRDQDELPPYEVLDTIVDMYLNGAGIDEIVAKGVDEQMVRDVIRRITNNEYKRKQAPLGLTITGKAFGCTRRYPVVQNFRE